MFIPKMVFNMPVTTSVQINPIPAGLENQDTLGGRVNLMQIIFKKPGFRLNGNAMGIKEKSENFNGLRQILFEACKKTTEVKLIFPPPAGIGLNSTQLKLDLLLKNPEYSCRL